jgi:NADH:ubiquinone oxidoreductase subunit 6 (subunit J)
VTTLLEAVAFAAAAVTILGGGLASALAKRTFHSVMFLGVVLVAVAGLYVILGSPLVGVLQILVYVGGILTLFVFAVMFVAGDETEETGPAGGMPK